MPSLKITSLLVGSAIALSGCRPGAAAEQLAQAPTMETATGQAQCGVKKSAAKPLIVEWPAAERAALESGASQGLVAVRYEGCEMEIITTCSAGGEYGYVGLTQKREGVKITSADELYAQLPVGAVGLEAKLERAGQLNVDMSIVGRHEASQSTFTERDLDGRCDSATHVVTGLTVGAFALYTGASAEVGGAVKFGNAGGGASASHKREVLRADGDQAACAVASREDFAPPEGCGALLRVEVVPVDRIFVTQSAPAEFIEASPSSSPSPQGSTLDRQIRRAKTMRNVGFYGLFGATIGIVGAALYVRALTQLRAEAAMETVSSGRQSQVTTARAGIGLMATGGAVVVVGLVLGIIGARRTNNLKAQRGMLGSVRPVIGPGGLGLTGRF